MKRKYVPIDDRGYRIPVDQWTRQDHVTFDGALPRGARDDFDDEVKDPESTNVATAIKGAASANKPREFVKGALSTNYFAEPAEDDEPDDNELSDEQIEALCEHCEENLGFSPEMLKSLRGKLSAKQAQDDDQPPAFRGQPLRGGKIRAMDAKGVGSFASRFPEAARISGDRMTNKRDAVPPSLAMDVKRRGAKSFAERHPDVARIKVL